MMSFKVSAGALGLVAALVFWSNSFGAEKAPKLIPAKTFSVQFPEMPPTFYALVQKTNVKAQMTVFLPANYDSAKKHPLFIFLNGGDGGNGASLGVARSLTEGKDFICVSMPLFKTTNAPFTGSGYIMNGQDGKYMWPFFKTMLARLDEAVPNLDPKNQVLGGFSNGAHAIAALLDESEGALASRFSRFCSWRGAGNCASMNR